MSGKEDKESGPLKNVPEELWNKFLKTDAAKEFRGGTAKEKLEIIWGVIPGISPANHVRQILLKHYNPHSLLSEMTPDFLRKWGIGKRDTNKVRFKTLIAELDSIYNTRSSPEQQAKKVLELFQNPTYVPDRTGKEPTDADGGYEKAYKLARLCFEMVYYDSLPHENTLSQNSSSSSSPSSSSSSSTSGGLVKNKTSESKRKDSEGVKNKYKETEMTLIAAKSLTKTLNPSSGSSSSPSSDTSPTTSTITKGRDSEESPLNIPPATYGSING